MLNSRDVRPHLSDFGSTVRARLSDGYALVRNCAGRARVGGDQKFAFIGGAAFSGVVGQLRYEQANGSTHVMGDVNGDGVADFVIQVTGLVSFTSGDFLL